MSINQQYKYIMGASHRSGGWPVGQPPLPFDKPTRMPAVRFVPPNKESGPFQTIAHPMKRERVIFSGQPFGKLLSCHIEDERCRTPRLPKIIECSQIPKVPFFSEGSGPTLSHCPGPSASRRGPETAGCRRMAPPRRSHLT